MILTAIDAIESHESVEIEMPEMPTQDLSEEDRNFVLDITILFENAVHTLGRYGHLLRTT